MSRSCFGTAVLTNCSRGRHWLLAGLYVLGGAVVVGCKHLVGTGRGGGRGTFVVIAPAADYIVFLLPGVGVYIAAMLGRKYVTGTDRAPLSLL